MLVVAVSGCGDDAEVVVVAARVGNRGGGGGVGITDDVARIGDKADMDGVFLVVVVALGAYLPRVLRVTSRQGGDEKEARGVGDEDAGEEAPSAEVRVDGGDARGHGEERRGSGGGEPDRVVPATVLCVLTQTRHAWLAGSDYSAGPCLTRAEPTVPCLRPSRQTQPI